MKRASSAAAPSRAYFVSWGYFWAGRKWSPQGLGAVPFDTLAEAKEYARWARSQGRCQWLNIEHDGADIVHWEG